MREGTDVSLIGFGKLVGYNLQAAEILEKEGISCEVCKGEDASFIVLVACGWDVDAEDDGNTGVESAVVEADR